MIKPNTLCMIRGVPKDTPGWDCNGKIVQAKERFGVLWRFEPALTTSWKTKTPYGTRTTATIDLSEPCFLHPLDDFHDELDREALDEVLERTFCEALERELSKV